MLSQPKMVSFDLGEGREVIIETGKLARQADGAVTVRQGNCILLATVVANKEPREGQDFFPLSVDYQEKFASAGRIPGSFFKREARLNDYEILTSRLIDRALRPLFPEDYLCDVQVLVTPYFQRCGSICRMHWLAWQHLLHWLFLIFPLKKLFPK